MNYFATPVSSLESYHNYKKTVLNGLEKSKYKSFVEERSNHYKNQVDNVRLWGIKSDKRSRWNKAQVNDVLFFYHNKIIISYCIIESKFEDNQLAEELWGSFENRYYPKYSWPLIFVLSEPIICNIPFSLFNKIIGYSENYFLRSFFKLSDSLNKFIDEKYGDVYKFATAESI